VTTLIWNRMVGIAINCAIALYTLVQIKRAQMPSPQQDGD